MKRKDGIYFHVLIAIFSLIIGFYCTNYLLAMLGHSNQGMNNGITEYVNNPGIFFFFKHNLSFFMLMSVLPFINIIFFIFQFISLGSNINIASTLPFNTQFTILYRHLFFEVIALFTAIYISYIYYNLSKNILKDKYINWKNELLFLGLLYNLIIICTLIGAVLEGNANVKI